MFDRIKKRLDRAVAHRVNALLEPVREQLERIEAIHADFDARLGGTQADFSFLRSEFDRLAPQLAAIEYRLEDMRRRLDVTDLDETSIIEQAELEHERARIRLELAAHYEERLRRLESGHE